MKLIEEHYRENSLRLVHIAQSLGLPKFLAEEAVQDVYVNILAYPVERGDLTKVVMQSLRNAVKKIFKQERLRGMTHVPIEKQQELYEDIKEAYEERNDR